jgi:predicted Zn-dependent protease
MKSLLVNKNWFLDYSITASTNSTNPLVKSYVGQATYFVTYLKDGTTKDSDGLTGKYTIEIINNQSQIHVQLITINGNPFEVIYDIISVGDTKLVLSKVVSSGTPTQLFFTNK